MPTQQQEIEFGELLERNNTTINSVCLRCCGGNAFYFDELRQECALALWREFSHHGLSRFRGDSTEATWIYQISYHAIVTYLRNPHHREFLSVCDLYGLEHLSASELGSQARDDWNLLDELREHLDNKERNLLDHYLSGDSYSTIARTEGITESNARKRMSRLLNKLRMLITKKSQDV
jgi:RNA polymerase sigma factor (sigma-70 family)